MRKGHQKWDTRCQQPLFLPHNTLDYTTMHMIERANAPIHQQSDAHGEWRGRERFRLCEPHKFNKNTHSCQHHIRAVVVQVVGLAFLEEARASPAASLAAFHTL
jgi:hypothetical protein